MNKKLVKQVLYQAFESGTKNGAVDIYADAWCLSDMGLDDWRKLEKDMLDEGLIYEAMPGHYAMTEKGRDFEGSPLESTEEELP